MNGDFNNINSFVRKATEDTKIIYGQIASPEKLSLFSELLKDKTADDVIMGRAYMVDNKDQRFICYAMSGDVPTNNIRYALVASGISSYGTISDNRCYPTVSLSPDENVVEQAKEYRQNANEVEMKISGIYNWMQNDEHAKAADPNAYELVELFAKVNNVKLSGGEISPKAEQQLNEIWENRKNNFVSNGIGRDNLSYQICNDCFNGTLSQQYIDLASIKALQKMAAVDLWLRQEKRNGNEVQYNNDHELTEIGNYINASKMVGMDLDVYINSFIQEINMTKTIEEGRAR